MEVFYLNQAEDYYLGIACEKVPEVRSQGIVA